MSIISNAIATPPEAGLTERQSGVPVRPAARERQHPAFLRARLLLSQSCKPAQASVYACDTSNAHLAIADGQSLKLQLQYQSPICLQIN